MAGVADAFQVSKHRVEFHADDSSNVFANNPSGANFPYNSQHFTPERTVVCLALSLPGNGKRLARESPGNNVNFSGEVGAVEVLDVCVSFSIWKVFLQNTAAKGVYFNLKNIVPTHSGRCQVEAADA